MVKFKVARNARGTYDVVDKKTGAVEMYNIATRTEANAWRDYFNAQDR